MALSQGQVSPANRKRIRGQADEVRRHVVGRQGVLLVHEHEEIRRLVQDLGQEVEKLTRHATDPVLHGFRQGRRHRPQILGSERELGRGSISRSHRHGGQQHRQETGEQARPQARAKHSSKGWSLVSPG